MIETRILLFKLLLIKYYDLMKRASHISSKSSHELSIHWFIFGIIMYFWTAGVEGGESEEGVEGGQGQEGPAYHVEQVRPAVLWRDGRVQAGEWSRAILRRMKKKKTVQRVSVSHVLGWLRPCWPSDVEDPLERIPRRGSSANRDPDRGSDWNDEKVSDTSCLRCRTYRRLWDVGIQVLVEMSRILRKMKVVCDCAWLLRQGLIEASLFMYLSISRRLQEATNYHAIWVSNVRCII